MTKPVLRRLHSPDVQDLSTWAPPDRSRFGVLIQAMIGPEGEAGDESFDFFVCTPAWLAGELCSVGFRFGLHCLIVAEYDDRLIEAAIQRLCDGIVGTDWAAVAALLSRYGRWEFEGYDAQLP